MKVILFLIRLYQKTLSPDHGPLSIYYPHGYCRFYPSCSAYAIDALACCGILKGTAKILSRLVRCNPWNAGGIEHALNKKRA